MKHTTHWIICLTLAAALLTVPARAEGEEPQPSPPVTAPAMPVIEQAPQSVSVGVGQGCQLSALGSSSDGGAISYLWYSSASADMSTMSAINRGAETGATLTVSTAAAGVTYYCVMITNTLNGQMSSLYSAVVSVTVTEQPSEVIESIAVLSPPGKLTYLLHETLDPTGLVLRLKTNLGERDVSTDYTCHPTQFDRAGQQEILVTYGVHSTAFTVTVQAEVPSVLLQPAGAVVKVGEAWQLTVQGQLQGSGSLSYLWYSSASSDMSTMTAVDRGSATGATLNADTSAPGTTYYCALVMNTDNGETASVYSYIATVTVEAATTTPPVNTPANTPLVSATPVPVPPATPGAATPTPLATVTPAVTPTAPPEAPARKGGGLILLVACGAACAAGVAGYAYWRLRRKDGGEE